MNRFLCILLLLSLTFADASLDSLFKTEPLQSLDGYPTLVTEFEGLRSDDNFSIEFVQKKHVVTLDRTLTSSGSISVSKSNGILWGVEKPYKQQLFIAASGDIFEDGVKIKNSSMRSASAMIGFFDLNFKDLQKRFDPYVVVKKQSWKLILKPRKKMIQKAVQYIVLEGDFDKRIKQVTFAGIDEEITTIEFTNYSKLEESDIRAFANMGN